MCKCNAICNLLWRKIEQWDSLKKKTLHQNHCGYASKQIKPMTSFTRLTRLRPTLTRFPHREPSLHGAASISSRCPICPRKLHSSIFVWFSFMQHSSLMRSHVLQQSRRGFFLFHRTNLEPRHALERHTSVIVHPENNRIRQHRRVHKSVTDCHPLKQGRNFNGGLNLL